MRLQQVRTFFRERPRVASLLLNSHIEYERSRRYGEVCVCLHHERPPFETEAF